jgi:hypothetical protein
MIRVKLGVVAVAQRLGIKYLKARDMMLAKRFGESMIEGKNLKVYEDGVALYETSGGARRVEKKKVLFDD